MPSPSGIFFANDLKEENLLAFTQSSPLVRSPLGGKLALSEDANKGSNCC